MCTEPLWLLILCQNVMAKGRYLLPIHTSILDVMIAINPEQKKRAVITLSKNSVVYIMNEIMSVSSFVWSIFLICNCMQQHVRPVRQIVAYCLWILLRTCPFIYRQEDLLKLFFILACNHHVNMISNKSTECNIF